MPDASSCYVCGAWEDDPSRCRQPGATGCLATEPQGTPRLQRHVPRTREDMVRKYRELQQKSLESMVLHKRQAEQYRREFEAYGERIRILSGVGDTVDA